MPLVKDVPDSPLVTSPQILTRKNETSIAYHKVEGKAPGVIFMNGFMSDMNGSKALALEQLCRDREQAFLRFDYQGHGKSSGEFTHCTIGTWAKDALAALDQLTDGPQIIVGSSMGGWIMLLTAIARPARVIGLVGISAAPDFTANSLPQQLTTKQLAEIDEKGIIVVPSEYEDPYTITKMLLRNVRMSSNLTKPDVDPPINIMRYMCIGPSIRTAAVNLFECITRFKPIQYAFKIQRRLIQKTDKLALWHSLISP